MLLTIVDDLRAPQTSEQQKDKSEGHGNDEMHGPREESGAEMHATGRLQAGFSVSDLISEFRALRASVLRLWGKCSAEVQQSDLDDITRFNEAIDQTAAESVTRYTASIGQAQDVFIGMLGHDLRNPLGAIHMSAQLLMQDAALGARQVKAASMIYNSGRQMGGLIGDLLDFTRTRLGKGIPVTCEQTDLAWLVRQAVDQASAYHPERSITLDATGDPAGQWDTARIGQVFSNLIGNAIKHGDPAAPIRIHVSGDAASVMASVNNMGAPIPAEELPHIFEPMHRAPSAGNGHPGSAGIGLGLYITQEIVHAHGGTVSVSSTLDAATTFTVVLPRRCPVR